MSKVPSPKCDDAMQKRREKERFGREICARTRPYGLVLRGSEIRRK